MTDRSYDALAAAHSRALARLGQDVDAGHRRAAAGRGDASQPLPGALITGILAPDVAAPIRAPPSSCATSSLGKGGPKSAWVALALIGVVLLVLPFAARRRAATYWVRITNLAILYVFLALGLNIVVGFAGLLDLGYIAFYAVGAYVYALLASPHFNLHLPFWIILPIGAAIACLFGVLLGAPTLKLRGDYLAIVTLGFGEIIRIFLNNLSQPVNITNGPQGLYMIDPFRIGDFSFAQAGDDRGPRFQRPDQVLLLLPAS